MSLEAGKATIRGRGERVTRYTSAQLRAQANEMIGPWLVVKAEARIAKRNSKDLRISKVRRALEDPGEAASRT